MGQDFSGKRIRGKSFSARDLQDGSFENADIRSANLSNVNLRNSSFKNAKFGIAPFWFITLFVSLIILAALASLIVAYTSTLVIVPEDTKPLQIVLESCLPLSITLLVLFVMARQGVGAALSCLSIFIAAIVPIFAAVAQYDSGSTTEYIVGQVAGRSFGLAGTIAGIIMSGAIVASGLAIGNRWLLAVLGVVALPVAIAAIDEGIGNKVNAIDWPLAISLNVLVFSLSIHIGFRAIKGDAKFQVIQALAIRFATFKGTRFKGANLTDADFSSATLKGADFTGAKLTRTC